MILQTTITTLDTNTLIAYLMFAGLYTIMVFLILFFVYKDSMKRKMNTTTWLLLVFFFGIVGLFFYLIVRINYKVKKR